MKATRPSPLPPAAKRAALKLARTTLNGPNLTGSQYHDALNTILIHGGRLGDAERFRQWQSLVESAYRRLTPPGRAAARFLTMSFRSECHDHTGVLRVRPKRFAGPFALVELALAMQAALALDNRPVARKLATRFARAIESADHACMQSYLLLLLADFCFREGKWVSAIRHAELALSIEPTETAALVAQAEMHAALALRAVLRGLRRLRPDDANANQKLKRLQSCLKRAMPESRLREMGLLARSASG